MTWGEVKAAIEAQGVEDSTIIGSIRIEANKPVTVVVNPNEENTVDVKDTP